MTRPSVVALLPMRHSSERVPGKNYRPFAGRPLFHHVLEALLQAPSVERVVIDTDSPEITAQVETSYPEVVVLPRPDHLLGGEVPMTSILAYDLSQVDGETFLQSHSTNPLLRSETIERAIEAYFESGTDIDSLFSVTRHQTRLWTADGRPLNHDPAVLARTQDLEPVYEENSNLYIFSRELIATTGRRFGERPLLFEIDPLEAVDIDEEPDFVLAEALFRLREAS